MKKVFLYLLCLLLLVLRYFASENYFQNIVWSNKDLIDLQKINGYVKELVSYSPAEVKFLVGSTAWQGNIFISKVNTQPLEVGQVVELTANKFQLWTDIQPGSFKNYLRLKKVWLELKNPAIKVSRNEVLLWSSYQSGLRKTLNEYLLQHFSADGAGLLAGTMFGDTSLLSPSTKNNFKIAGLSHLMAVSGANMTMISQLIFKILFFLHLRKRVIITIPFLLIFTLFVGANAAVLRAFLMAIISLWGTFLGKPYLAIRALALTVILIFIYDPSIVLYDIGFQLSSAATFGLLFSVKFFERCLNFIPWKSFQDTCCITLAATLFTSPLLLFYFSSMSLLAPLINVLLTPLLSLLSIGGYLFLSISFIPGINSIVFFTTDLILHFLLALVAISAYFANQYIINLVPSSFSIAIFYFVLIILMRR